MRSHRMLKICAFSFIFYAGGVSLNSKEKGARKYLWPFYQVAHILQNVIIARAPSGLDKITIKFSNLGSVASSPSVSTEGRFLGLEGGANNKEMKLPEIVKPGHLVLYKPSQEVDPFEIKSERVQKIIDDMIFVMRKANGISLSAPQIGIPLRIIILENKKRYTGSSPKEVINAQERQSVVPLVILNPKLEKKSNRTRLFFEACLSVAGYGAVVERCLDVEVTGLDRNGEPITIAVSDWQAMVLQHECDHLDGTLYVDKMVPRTFIAVKTHGRD